MLTASTPTFFRYAAPSTNDDMSRPRGISSSAVERNRLPMPSANRDRDSEEEGAGSGSGDFDFDGDAGRSLIRTDGSCRNSSITVFIARMWAGVDPQQAPMMVTPACSSSAAYCARYSGVVW